MRGGGGRLAAFNHDVFASQGHRGPPALNAAPFRDSYLLDQTELFDKNLLNDRQDEGVPFVTRRDRAWDDAVNGNSLDNDVLVDDGLIDGGDPFANDLSHPNGCGPHLTSPDGDLFLHERKNDRLTFADLSTARGSGGSGGGGIPCGLSATRAVCSGGTASQLSNASRCLPRY
jgi:hypothetical protein